MLSHSNLINAIDTVDRLQEALFLIEACTDACHVGNLDEIYSKQNVDKIRFFTDLYYDTVKELLPELRSFLDSTSE